MPSKAIKTRIFIGRNAELDRGFFLSFAEAANVTSSQSRHRRFGDAYGSARQYRTIFALPRDPRRFHSLGSTKGVLVNPHGKDKYSNSSDDLSHYLWQDFFHSGVFVSGVSSPRRFT